MNILQILKILSMGVSGIVLATGITWAVNGGIKSGDKQQIFTIQAKLTRGVAPEIDAASGTSAIALLTGFLLLVGEKSRPWRS